jgi:hypothetical protein
MAFVLRPLRRGRFAPRVRRLLLRAFQTRLRPSLTRELAHFGSISAEGQKPYTWFVGRDGAEESLDAALFRSARLVEAELVPLLCRALRLVARTPEIKSRLTRKAVDERLTKVNSRARGVKGLVTQCRRNKGHYFVGFVP